MSDLLLPLPPPDLAARVGTVAGADPLEFYRAEGARVRERIEGLLPEDWSWDGKRVLDFGCGSARVLRHFADEAERGEFWGCDIDAPSIDWAKASLSPPFRFLLSGPAPPVSLASASLDLIWATSVFTHITDLWSDWLLEMHRLLAPGGLLVASWLGEGIWDALVEEPYPEEAVGMTVLRHWEGPDAWVFHSEWWLREHWGRAFEVVQVQRPPRGPDGAPAVTHSYVVLRRREVQIDRGGLERVDASEPRELDGLQTSVRLARREQATLAAAGPLALPDPVRRFVRRRLPRLAPVLRAVRRGRS